MPAENTATGSNGAGQIPVSPDNPCPFLRALVAGGFVGGHVVPLSTLAGMVEAASGETGWTKKVVGIKTRLVALIANGLGPLRLWRSWWSGAVLDELRNGPLDKHGVGSRILGVDGQVNETEIAHLAGFGHDCENPSGGSERGLTSGEIATFMKANFDRANNRRWYDPMLMQGEWPVLLNILGKGEGDARYLSVAEVSTLFNERRLPARIVERLASAKVAAPGGVLRVLGKIVLAAIAVGVLLIVAIAEFPDQLQKILPRSSRHYCRRPRRSRRRSGRRIGWIRTGRWRTGTGFIMQARAP